MKILRRTHMFAGLFMLPWVLVYGLSALVFNHNSWFYPAARKNAPAQLVREVDALPEGIWQSGPLADVGTAESLAARILKEMNQSHADASAGWTLAGDAEAKFTRVLVLEGAGGGTNLEVQINLSEQSGTLTRRVSVSNETPARQAPESRRFNPAAAVVFDGAWREDLTRQLSATDAAEPGESKPLRIKNAPELLFSADLAGRRWSVRCNLVNGEVTAREAGAGAGFVARTAGFITRLHKTHRYPGNSEITIRWWWALLMDATAFLMLFWGVSGLAMWWQMKGQRRWGAVAMTACAVVTWFIWTGMQSAFR